MLLESLIPIVSWIFPFLVVLTVLVFVHELGHYLVARYNGVKVEVFSIGFGPELFGWMDSKGTRWKFSLIPLGGYVRMFGDANEASVPDFEQINALSKSDREQTLMGKTVWQRMVVSIAGPVANIFLTFMLFSLVFFFYGKASETPIIGDIVAGSVAEKAGIQSEDRIVRINEFMPHSFKEVQTYINNHPSERLSVEVERGGSSLTYQITPEAMEVTAHKKIGFIGVSPLRVKKSLWDAPYESLKSVGVMSADLLKSLAAIVSSGENAGKLGSVLSIAKMSKDSLHGGLFSLFFFMAVLSLNLGIINLLPIPMLDGGHLLFYIIEVVRGKPVGEKGQNIAYKIGFGVLLFVMLFTLWNDLTRFKVVEYFLALFK
ncbi:MAG: RIP metalloprotease RseP [Alphaproteobacteria bacterium RIFCSPLOWO2_01_FULL_45_8]|nr:MAG: RIP metalloprotease RseP [Alphaproteobacteria bacterium GWB1_45_5]OFW76706.1 MAG: RIP metalloprotease RseP [Alphaproteobacteria bacterium GWA1_45_9]OFW89786.1 MAG: RIP metalloprotease RseP [Alphaproteobacteria bacterium RIFCSPHIGHO2_01_FULL_41_14]OFW96486.1 MAG: RIP metalloprotease RseP [Alphaproteobacteria bacterium RIFCSPLOWO2_01_FULL_45_8]HCI48914.1 RIP metalloprotease RseP [Holosporales bacterium]